MKIETPPIPVRRLMIQLRAIVNNAMISGRVLVFDAWPRDNESLRRSYSLGIPWREFTFQELADAAEEAVLARASVVVCVGGGLKPQARSIPDSKGPEKCT